MTGHLLALLLVGAVAGPGEAEERGEVLVPGQARERSIAAGETHVWRLGAGGEPILVTVEQRGIDLVVEGRAGARRRVRCRRPQLPLGAGAPAAARRRRR